MGCRDNDGFALLPGYFLHVKRYYLSGVPIQASSELVHEPPLLSTFDEFGYAVTVFLTVAKLAIAAKKKESIVEAKPLPKPANATATQKKSPLSPELSIAALISAILLRHSRRTWGKKLPPKSKSI